MASPTLTLSAVLALASAIGFLLCARLALRGSESGGARLALASFWMGAAMVAGVQGARSASVLLGWDSFLLIRVLDQTATPAYCLSAGGLAYYVVFILTGNSRLAFLPSIYYFLMIPVLRYPVEAARPIGYTVADWNVNLVYAGSLAGPVYTAALAATALPLIGCVLAYTLVLLRVPDAPSRYRVACTAAAFLLWIGIEVAIWGAGLAGTGTGEITRRLVGLIVALVIGIGYFPPLAAKRRWGARSVDEGS